MLTPEQVSALRDAAGQIADPITEYLIADIAKRISEAGQLTSTASYEIWRTQQLGVSQREIKKRLRELLKVSHRDLRKLLTQSAETGYNFDIKNLPQVQAVPFAQNEVMQQIVSAAVKLAQEDFTNITQTLGMVDPYGKALPLQEAYRSATDFAFKQVSTGAADYNTAIRQATKNLAKYGVRTIDYESGVHTSLEAAVRRNIMGGLGLMQEQISLQNHDDMGADGWEISAHANSAPDHEPIQGKQYSDAEYTALNGGLQRRIGTLNCGHAAFPIIMGISKSQYTEEELRKFRESNTDGITYQGKHYTGYQATQQQRDLERAIRAQKRRVLIANQTTDADYQKTAKTRLTLLNQEYRRFSKAAGLRTQMERAQVDGLGNAA
ncbi:MAG: phage minor capsid protein [Bacillota bacterium]